MPDQEIETANPRWPLLSCIRYREVLILQGPPLMGVALSIGKLTVGKLPAVIVFAAASFILVAHIWSLNDWADIHTDRDDRNKSARVFSGKGVNPREMLWLSISLLVASLGLYALLGPRTLLIGALIAFMGFLYSHGGINAKGNPLVSSATHLAGGMLHFLLGYSLFAAIDWKAAMIASFFAVVFTAGHATQEVQDYEVDRLKGIRTNAVVFGKIPVFIASFAGFALAYGDLLWLSLAGILQHRLWPLPAMLFPLQAYWSIEALRRNLGHDCVMRLRSRYRVLFAIIGLGIVSSSFF